MIQATNTIIYEDIDFDSYLQFKGYSYSGLKNEGKTFTPTAKMRLGTQIHNFLFEPEKYKPEASHDIVKSVGGKVLALFGNQWDLMQFEVSVTSDFELSNRLSMPYKGRLDVWLPKVALIDLKVSEMPLAQSIPHFGYDNQLSGYGLATGIDALFIVRVNPKRPKEIEIKQVARVEEFWVNSIILKGQVMVV